MFPTGRWRRVMGLWLVLVSVGLASGFGVVEAASPYQAGGTALPGAVGRWVSPGCETRSAGGANKLYVKRDNTIGPASSSLTLVVYAEANCQTPNLTFVFDGPYTVGKASATGPGVYEADFKFASVRLTANSDGIVKLLDSAPANTCGKAPWQLNAAQDITATNGCAILGVDLKACPAEYDLLKVEGNNLYYGARPENGGGPCAPNQRPTTLQVPLVRQGSNLPAQAPASGGGAGLAQSQAGTGWLPALPGLVVVVLAGGLLLRRPRRR